MHFSDTTGSHAKPIATAWPLDKIHKNAHIATPRIMRDTNKITNLHIFFIINFLSLQNWNLHGGGWVGKVSMLWWTRPTWTIPRPPGVVCKKNIPLILLHSASGISCDLILHTTSVFLNSFCYGFATGLMPALAFSHHNNCGWVNYCMCTIWFYFYWFLESNSVHLVNYF